MIWDLLFSSFKFSNVFILAQTVILDYFWVEFWSQQRSLNFWPVMASKTMHHLSCHHWCIMVHFFEVLRNGRNGAKKLFLLTPSYTLWDFANWKTLLRHTCGKFHLYSICGCEIKISKYFVFIEHPWNGLFLGYFGPLLPQILFDIEEVLTRGSLQ